MLDIFIPINKDFYDTFICYGTFDNECINLTDCVSGVIDSQLVVYYKIHY